MYRGLQRFRTSGSSIVKRLSVPQLRRKASNSWSAMQDTFYSTKDIFERHKVVFTISTSIASVATAWFGYTLRHLHESRVDQRLGSIEEAMKHNYKIEDPEFKKLVSGSISVPACVATAGTTLILGYGLGWRGGKWYANRKFRREQMKLLGQLKPKRWPLRFLRRPLLRPKSPENLVTGGSEPVPKDASLQEQMKLLGQIIPKRWPLRFFQRPLVRPKSSQNLVTGGSEALPKDTSSVSHS